MIRTYCAYMIAGSLFLGIDIQSALAETSSTIPSLDQLVTTGNGTVSGRIVQLIVLMTVLKIAPGLLIMVTCFTRFIIALSFLRTGLGLQSTPSNIVLISLAMFMTFFVMAPVFQQAWDRGLGPLLENKISEKAAFDEITGPFRVFMKRNVREQDLKLFVELSQESKQTLEANIDIKDQLHVLIPAFMISEIRRGFEIGFLIILPFLVIDLIVATLTMSMGMMMMPPTVISVPFKILFFVLMDGWNLLVGGLVRSFY